MEQIHPKDSFQEEEESLMEYTIAVFFENITINLKKSINCIIKYMFPSFLGTREFENEPFAISPEVKGCQEVPSGFREHIIPEKMKESDVCTFLKNHPLCIKIYDQNE